jgi:hypothetical protein
MGAREVRVESSAIGINLIQEDGAGPLAAYADVELPAARLCLSRQLRILTHEREEDVDRIAMDQELDGYDIVAGASCVGSHRA